MHKTANYLYTEGDDYQAIELPYVDYYFKMVILLPKEGKFHAIEELLTADWVQQVISGFHDHEVNLTMPKCRLKTNLSGLTTILSKQ